MISSKYFGFGRLAVTIGVPISGFGDFFGHAWVVLPSDGVPLLDHNDRV